MMKWVQVFVIVLLFAMPARAQFNLLANPGFEDRNICIEFRAGCAPEAWFRLPLVPLSISGVRNQNQYVSVIMENFSPTGSDRNYIYTRLLCNTEAGKKYRFSAWIRPSEETFDHLDLLLLSYEPNRNKAFLPAAKKIMITPAQMVEEKDQAWTEYSFEFTAKGDERYLMLGNFSKDKLPRPLHFVNISYDIDNVSLTASETPNMAGCAEAYRIKTMLYYNNSRHTPNNYLDDEEPLAEAPHMEAPVISPVIVPTVIDPPIPPVVVNDTLVIPDVLFRLNSAVLNPQFANRLDTLVAKIKTRSFKNIGVIGHTDSLGSSTLNQSLSQRRAEAVRDYLIMRLAYPSNLITATGMAAQVPVASNKTAAGRQKNRRVEIVLVR